MERDKTKRALFGDWATRTYSAVMIIYIDVQIVVGETAYTSLTEMMFYRHP